MGRHHETIRRIAGALLSAALLAFTWTTARAQQAIVESARQIPVAYDVDVVVVGGSTGAVNAAVAAAKDGAKVFLAAPRPYLGEDACGTLQLWLHEGETPETPLEKKLFEVAASPQAFAGRLPFKYEADQPSGKVHADTKPPSRLSDGNWSSAAQHSVQFDKDVTITADLGQSRRVAKVHLLVYQRDNVFEVADMHVFTSPNGTLWRDLGVVKNEQLGQGAVEEGAITISLPVKQPTRYVKLLVRKTERSERMLLGELVIEEDQPTAPVVKARPQPPTPMHIKYALDQALLDAGVTFLYGCPVTDVLKDKDGKVAGIVMANRAGRQAVRAKVVIDATPRAVVARMAGAEFKPFTPGPHTFERVVVGGKPHPGDNAEVTTVDVQFISQQGAHDVFVYRLTIPMADASFASFAKAEQVARDRTFDPALVDESDVLRQIPPDPVVAMASATGDAFDPATLDLAALQPKQHERLYVLGGCADVSRKAADALMRPLGLMRLGERVGSVAAKQATALAASSSVSVARMAADQPADAGEVREFLQGVRPTDEGRPTVPAPQRPIPVLGSYDVVVVGGGTGGAPAGIGAARRGAKTLVIEYQDALGGVGTLGLVSQYYFGNRSGFTAEVDRGVAGMEGTPRKGGWNVECKAEWWRSEIRKAGGDVWFSTLGCGALVDGPTVKGVLVATPLGRGVVLAKSVIDSTGNADIPAAAGAETVTTSADHIAMQGTGLPPWALGTGYTNTDYSFVDESDPIDQWRMIVTAREKYKRSYDLSPFIDTRERRRIIGDAYISPLDIVNNRTYPDTIAIHQSNFDTHGYTVHPVFLINFPDKKGMSANVPYRALIPKGLEGVLVTGLGISAHRDAMPILRMQACIQNQGYAAGVAAAMSAQSNSSIRNIDIKALQKRLVEIGSITPNVLNAEDSYPIPAAKLADAVKTVTQDYRGLSVLLAQPEQATPLLREAYKAATAPEHKVVYANILGMLGDATGSGSLIEAVDAQPWDEGWNFRGMGQFGGSISRLDSLIIALGRSGNRESLPAILRKVESLDASKEFSHHRAVAMALETLRDPSAAPALAKLLSKPGMTGYAVTTVDEQKGEAEQRSQPLREIILARALYRCGDHEGLGRSILEKYAHDLRGLFAKHANAVLKEGR